MFGEYDSEDPRSLEFGLTAMPPHNDGVAQMVPIPPKAVPAWAKQLYELGYRHHPDKMVKFPVPGDNPGMGWMNPNKFVSKEEYEKTAHSETPQPTNGMSMSDAMSLLGAIDPTFAKRISSMTEDERRSAAEASEAQVPQLIANLAKARELMEEDINGGGS